MDINNFKNSKDIDKDEELALVGLDDLSPEKDFETENVEGGYIISKYTGSSEAVLIPSSINGLPVVSISIYAFHDCENLQRVIIPDGVYSLGDRAPSSRVIRGLAGAFHGCKNLKSTTLPASVTDIGRWEFSKCVGLESIYVDADNASFCSVDGVLFNKEKTVLLKYPAGKDGNTYIIPDGVVTIGEHAFSECRNLAAITIPDSVAEIEIGAFQYCEILTDIHIPNSIEIGYCAFENCTSLKNITISDNNTMFSSENGVLFNKDKSVLIKYPEGRELECFFIPDSVSEIASCAFWKCKALKSIVFPDKTSKIGHCVFTGCKGLLDITIPYGNIRIEDGSFQGCSNLTNVTIPASVTEIGEFAFAGCTSLTSITIPGDSIDFWPWSFLECTNLMSINIHAKRERTIIGYQAFPEHTAINFISNKIPTDDPALLTQYPKNG
jgi:hypothetical protein